MRIKKLAFIFLILSFGLFAQSAYAQQSNRIGTGVLHVLGLDIIADPS